MTEFLAMEDRAPRKRRRKSSEDFAGPEELERTIVALEEEMLAAALLHDVGKAEGRVPFWTRPVIVIGKRCAPRLLSRLAGYPRAGQSRWRRALGGAWWHAEIGADMAAQAGLSERAVLYIRTHHQPGGPAAELHVVDEAS